METVRHGTQDLFSSFPSFLELFQKKFAEIDREDQTSTEILRLKQGPNSALHFSSDVCRLLADLNWNEPFLIYVYRVALRQDIQEVMTRQSKPKNMEDLIQLSIDVDKRFAEYIRAKANILPKPQPRAEPIREQMDLSNSKKIHLTPEGKARRELNSECVYCASSEHLVEKCPIKPKSRFLGRGGKELGH